MDKIVRTNLDGTVTVIDNRKLDGAKKQYIDDIKHLYKKKILSEVPQYKQSNIALGIYSKDESQKYVNAIIIHVNKCNEIEKAVNDCKSLEELDKLFSNDCPYKNDLRMEDATT